LNEWSLESIGLIALDARLGILDDPNETKVNRLIKHIFQATYDYDIQPSVWRYFQTPGFKRVMELYEETAEEIKKYVMLAVEKFEKNPSPDDHERGILEKLIKIDKNIGIAMAEDMLLAGVDTTSSAMVAVLYNLAQNPDKQDILRQEILRILPEKDSKLSATSFNEVPYLRAVIKESLRLRPVVNGNMRKADNDIVLQGYKIPKGVNFDNLKACH
jgi:cytochrome P450 family 12